MTFEPNLTLDAAIIYARVTSDLANLRAVARVHGLDLNHLSERIEWLKTQPDAYHDQIIAQVLLLEQNQPEVVN